jgi:hypothetical protein
MPTDKISKTTNTYILECIPSKEDPLMKVTNTLGHPNPNSKGGRKLASRQETISERSSSATMDSVVEVVEKKGKKERPGLGTLYWNDKSNFDKREGNPCVKPPAYRSSRWNSQSLPVKRVKILIKPPAHRLSPA